MKLRKILLDEHYRQYWKQGPILPDPYPPDHPSAPCYKCNQLCQGLVNWLESVFRFLLVPNRRHRMRYFFLICGLICMMMLLNRGQHPMTLSHNIHSPTYQNSIHGFLFSGLFGQDSNNHKLARRPLIQDWVFAPNCDALLRGDEEEVHFTKRMLYREVRDKVPDIEYYEITKSCADFRAAEGYAPVALSVEESNFPIAYIIQSYRNAEQLNRLLRAIYAPQNPYCICSNHKATPDFDRSVHLITNCFRNVFHASTLKFNRTKNHATEVDDIKCARRCMNVLLNFDWKYVIKIHSQDFPLVTSQYITAKLKNLERLKIPFISDYSHMQRKQTAKIVMTNSTFNDSETTDITLWRGSPYFIASKSIIQQIMDNTLTYKLLPTIQHHEHSEAYYWVTLFLHVMGDANHAAIVAANMHRIELLTHKNLHTKQYCAGVTQLMDHCILGVEDLSKLFHAHQHQFFAHGFDLDHDHVAYNCLEQRITDAVADYTGNLTLTFNDRKLHATQPEIDLKINENELESWDDIEDGQVMSFTNILEKVKEKGSHNVVQVITNDNNITKIDGIKVVSTRNHTSRVKKPIKPEEDVKKTLKPTTNNTDEASKDITKKELNIKEDPTSKLKSKDEKLEEMGKKQKELESSVKPGNDTVTKVIDEEKKQQLLIQTVEPAPKPDELINDVILADNEKKVKQINSSDEIIDSAEKLPKDRAEEAPQNGDILSPDLVKNMEDETYEEIMSNSLEPVTESAGVLATVAPTEEIQDLLKAIHAARHKHETQKLQVDMLDGDDYNNDYVENMDLGNMDKLKSRLNLYDHVHGKNTGEIEELSDDLETNQANVISNKVNSLDRKQPKDSETVIETEEKIKSDDDDSLMNIVR